MAQPQPPLSAKWRKGFLTAIAGLCVCIMLIGSLVVALAAQHRASQTAECVNRILALRAGPSLRDKQATDAVIDAAGKMAAAQALALLKAKADPDAVVPTLIQTSRNYQAAVAAYKKTRAADDAFNTAHPLGAC